MEFAPLQLEKRTVADVVASQDGTLGIFPSTDNTWYYVTSEGVKATLGVSESTANALIAAYAAPLSHSHGNITNDGKIGSTENLPLITTASGVVTVGSFGSTANTFCQGNDSRLSDARTPLAHNQSWSTITSTPTTLSGYGITDAQPLDTDLTQIAALTGAGFPQRSAGNTWSLNAVVAAQNINNNFTVGQTINGSLSATTVSVTGGVFARNGIDILDPTSGVSRWLLYTIAGDTKQYNRDRTNNRMHITLEPGATDELALTTLSSRLSVGGSSVFTGLVTCSSGFVYAQRTKAAVLASSVAVNSGRFQLTDAGLVGRCVYPDGTNWRYEHDNSIVS